MRREANALEYVHYPALIRRVFDIRGQPPSPESSAGPVVFTRKRGRGGKVCFREECLWHAPPSAASMTAGAESDMTQGQTMGNRGAAKLWELRYRSGRHDAMLARLLEQGQPV